MEAFSTPPPGGKNRKEEGKPLEPTVAPDSDSFGTMVTPNIMEEEEKLVTKEVKEQFMLSFITDTAFLRTLDIFDGKIKLTFGTKSMQTILDGWVWINRQVAETDIRTIDNYHQIVGVADLAGYLVKIQSAIPELPTLDLSQATFQQKLERVLSFSSAKVAILLESMLRFIAWLEVLRNAARSSRF